MMTFPVIVAGRWLGELQGRQQFGRLAGAMALLGLGRYGGLLVALVSGLGVTASLVVGVVTTWGSLGLIVWLTGHAAPAPDATRGGEQVRGREVLRAGGATAATIAISYADLILARALLPADDAGAYAVGSVLTRGALWAPAVLTVMAVPHFARARRHAVKITLASTGVCGVVLILASGLFGDLAMRIAGGTKYDHLGSYAVGFATLGAMYALVFVIVNAEIAKLVRRPALWLWAALGAMGAAAIATSPSTMGGVLVLALIVATATLAVSTAIFAIRLRRWRVADRAAAQAALAGPDTPPVAA
jgi:O-antigen/teichoic acid export membrane protein